LAGYRTRPNLNILLVEVLPKPPDGESAEPPEPRGYIVKAAHGDAVGKLVTEWSGWSRTRPPSLVQDSIFVPLCRGAGDWTSATAARTLVYGDAYQLVGAGRVISLEDAVLACCRWGVPTVASLDHVLRSVYQRLGLLFYSGWYVPDAADNMKLLDEPLSEWLKTWCECEKGADEEPMRERLFARREALALLARRRDQFLDPCDYLASVRRCRHLGPRMLRGRGHGDLHGRNILVSLADDEATAPAVFDYEDMAPDNLLAWDFVKLETELKVRAVQALFPGPDAQFVDKVHRLEVELAERTEQRHDGNNWDEGFGELKSGRDRLAALVLAIRRQAARHLGSNRGRGREWLEEYYFALACYGAQVGRFQGSYLRREWMAAYVSAGVVCRRLWRPWKLLEGGIRAAEDEAAGVLGDEKAEEVLAGRVKDGYRKATDCEMSYHDRLAFAMKWSRSGREKFQRAAAEVLRALRKVFSHALEIDEELAFVLLELGDDAEAEDVLGQVQRRYRFLHYEAWCRIGRLWKDRAVKRLGPGGDVADPQVKRELAQALNYYRRGYGVDGHYYPGINVATLMFLLGDSAGAAALAQALLDNLPPEGSPEEALWVTATSAEAHLLRGDHVGAEREYRAAAHDPACPPHARATMRRQVELIRRFADDKANGYWTDKRLDEVFA
ncbi:MAG TPA: TRAFs-binding domain-containing protein, partial [Gemmataceae bacterium]|nr:TRAFs-binding domain-containing protein [Gemmataceae bacterium]